MATVAGGGGGGGGEAGVAYGDTGIVIESKLIILIDDFYKGIGADYSLPNFDKKEIDTKVQLQNGDNIELGELIDAEPEFEKREVSTQVVVQDGNTVVLGGLLNDEVELDDQSRIPVLSKIPYIARLFRNTSEERDNRKLLVFITPRLINSEEE